MANLNYQEDLHIDEDALDLEWLGQPALMFQYTQAEADARREVDRLKEKLSVCKAELDHGIRSYPEQYKIEKITENVVQNVIITEEGHKDLMEELIEAQHEYNSMRGAVQAVDQRKSSLENLVKLHGQQYFAGPKEPRDLPKEVRQADVKRRSISTIKFKRRK